MGTGVVLMAATLKQMATVCHVAIVLQNHAVVCCQRKAVKLVIILIIKNVTVALTKRQVLQDLLHHLIVFSEMLVISVIIMMMMVVVALLMFAMVGIVVEQKDNLLDANVVIQRVHVIAVFLKRLVISLLEMNVSNVLKIISQDITITTKQV